MWPNTTVSINAVSHVEPGEKILTTSFTVQVTKELQHDHKPDPYFLTTSLSITLLLQWPESSCLH
jgi:hypothetical protein